MLASAALVGAAAGLTPRRSLCGLSPLPCYPSPVLLLLLACSQTLEVPGPPPADAEAAWQSTLAAVVSPAGLVRYEALRERRASLDGYLAFLAQNPGPLSEDEALARSINAYNAFVLAGVLDRWPIDSVRDVHVGLFRAFGAGFFKGLRFRLDGESIDLDTLERQRVRTGDPRVHAALNCASMGCPPLRAELWRAESLDADLDAAVRRMLETRVSVDGDTLVFSEIFDWFEDDFLVDAPDICAWAARYRPDWQSFADAGCPHRFAPYDWSLNAAVAPPPLATAPRPWGEPGPCPPGMVFVAGGTYTTGMKPPLPYGVVDTRGMTKVDAPERGCPGAIAATPDASACWVRTDLWDPVLPLHEVSVDGYCMERLPFPGGGAYPPDGMSTWDAARFDELLASGRFGPRRMCRFTEYELAVAGPTKNLRFLYGDRADDRRCPGDEAGPIGAFPDCANPETGVAEYGAVISQWVVADPQFAANACDRPGCAAAGGRPLLTDAGEPGIRYLVAGGTRRVQTRQAPYTPHTWHDHGEASGSAGCDAWGWDDGPAVCGDPDERYARCPSDPTGPGCEELALAEARWSALESWCRGRTMTECLDLGLGEARQEATRVCPESTGALGPGQGR